MSTLGRHEKDWRCGHPQDPQSMGAPGEPPQEQPCPQPREDR